MPARRSSKTNLRSGFTLIEVMLAMIVFLMMVLVFAAVFPFAITGAKYSNNYAQASLIAQQKIEELRKLSWSGLNFSTASSVTTLETTMVNEGIADSGTCTTNATVTPPSVTCSFANVDNLINSGATSGYFPPGTTATYTIQSDTNTINVPPVNDVFNIWVSINWPSAGAPAGSFTTATKVVEMAH
jgi:prepilin-type N-terminal cleavage/methylation domain-containing protein